MRKTAIFVVGIPGSGKTTVGKSLSEKLPAEMVEVSDLVKELSSVSAREQLQTETAHLDNQIIRKITNVFMHTDNVVITGVRQPQIILDFMSQFRRGTVDIMQVNLVCDKEQARGRVKDSIESELTEEQYEELLARDNALGLRQTLELTLHTPDVLSVEESSFPSIESKVEFVLSYIKNKEGEK